MSVFLFLLVTFLINYSNARPDENIQIDKRIENSHDLTALPALNLDIISVVKTLVKNELQEESKSIIKQIKDEINPPYPQSNLNLVTLGGKKYFMYKWTFHWINAIFFCRMYNMDLLSLETRQEKDLILSYIIQNGLYKNVKVHLSANRLGGSSDWKWLNGNTVESIDWAPGEPNAGAISHCLHLLPSGQIGDSHCGEAFHVICEGR